MKRAIVAVVGIVAVMGAGSGVRADHSWGDFHWKRGATAVSLTVVDSVTTGWDSALDGAIADWNTSGVIDLTRADGSTRKKSRLKCKVASGTIRVCNAAYGRNGWLGIAHVWLEDGHIAKARTKLNDSYFKSARYDNPVWRNFVTCQELGHNLGLDHQDEGFGNPNIGTCMDYTNDPTTNQHPNLHDFEHLAEIYAHVDTASPMTTSSSSSTSGMHTDHPDHRVELDGKFTKLTFIYRAK